MILWKTRLDEGEEVDLFVVENTAKNAALVLAKDSVTARAIAQCCGHIKNERNGNCYRLGLEKGPSWVRVSMPAVRRAAKERVQGLIKPAGNFVTIGDEVFSPLSAVD